MQIMQTALLVLSNVPSEPLARAITQQLVEKRLAACVNIMPMMRSVYQWQGQVEQADEVALFIKTTSERYAEVEQTIRAMHPYDVPEIIALPITDGLPGYLDWIAQEVRKDIDV
jgi:periplasmic divalent cation tolerance protein